MYIIVIIQRLLSYHIARMTALQKKCEDLGYRMTVIEVASQDASYGYHEPKEMLCTSFQKICCFSNTSYHDHRAYEINRKVFQTLSLAKPDVVFAPATQFPEGMAAVQYRMQSHCKVVIMDDAWERTDYKQGLTRIVKKYIHKNVDAVFVPFISHQSYYERMGFPRDRIFFGVDVIDNTVFLNAMTTLKENSAELKATLKIPNQYFLFVGRFLKRKGLETLIAAFCKYRQSQNELLWDLVLVGDGPCYQKIQLMAEGIDGIKFVGQQHGKALHCYYSLAYGLIVPSESDPWGLVVNEGMASGLPVIVSKGCGASALIDEGNNGWCFEPGDVSSLLQRMRQLTMMSDFARKAMGARSIDIISNLSLERFVESVVRAANIPRRTRAGIMSNIFSKLWKGRVSIN